MRRWAVGGAGALGVLVAVAAGAWACVSGPSVTLSTVHARPGEEVTLTMRDFRRADPIMVRWNALDGPVLATFEHPGNGVPFQGTVAVPETAGPGNYVLVFTQQGADGKLTQMPVRNLLTVVAATGATPVLGAPLSQPEVREAGLVRSDDGVSGATLALIALGVAGIGMFLAGMAALFAGRRSQVAEPARTGR
jgi:hypothetical protein